MSDPWLRDEAVIAARASMEQAKREEHEARKEVWAADERLQIARCKASRAREATEKAEDEAQGRLIGALPLLTVCVLPFGRRTVERMDLRASPDDGRSARKVWWRETSPLPRWRSGIAWAEKPRQNLENTPRGLGRMWLAEEAT